MRYIDLKTFIADIPIREKLKLFRINKSMVALSNTLKETRASNGNIHWAPIKQYLEGMSNRKCWYTESKNPGFPNEVEHFRPKAKVYENGTLKHWYWFLAFNPYNYRLSSQFPNRLNVNPILGATGGKGDKFPLIASSQYATCFNDIRNEIPMLLDPCNRDDVELLVFHPDGRPVLSPRFQHDTVARERVETSNLLLNLDYPTFNEEREALYNKIHEIVLEGDINPTNIALINSLRRRLKRLMQNDAAYSKAAECYIRCFRDRPWVESLII